MGDHPVGLYGAPHMPSASDIEAAADQYGESGGGEPAGAKTHSSKQRMSERLHCRSLAGDLRSKRKGVHAAAATVSSTQVGRDAEMLIEIAGHAVFHPFKFGAPSGRAYWYPPKTSTFCCDWAAQAPTTKLRPRTSVDRIFISFPFRKFIDPQDFREFGVLSRVLLKSGQIAVNCDTYAMRSRNA